MEYSKRFQKSLAMGCGQLARKKGDRPGKMRDGVSPTGVLTRPPFQVWRASSGCVVGETAWKEQRVLTAVTLRPPEGR